MAAPLILFLCLPPLLFAGLDWTNAYPSLLAYQFFPRGPLQASFTGEPAISQDFQLRCLDMALFWAIASRKKTSAR